MLMIGVVSRGVLSVGFGAVAGFLHDLARVDVAGVVEACAGGGHGCNWSEHRRAVIGLERRAADRGDDMRVPCALERC